MLTISIKNMPKMQECPQTLLVFQFHVFHLFRILVSSLEKDVLLTLLALSASGAKSALRTSATRTCVTQLVIDFPSISRQADKQTSRQAAQLGSFHEPIAQR